MILKDEALALRFYPFGNTSRIVVWLSRSYGKLATLAKGSQRERSAFLGQFDLFYTCEILFYAREQRNLHVLKECVPLETRPAFRTDWRACAAASYAAGLLDRAMPFGPAPAGLFDLLAETLDQLAARTPGPAFLPRFELRLLRERWGLTYFSFRDDTFTTKKSRILDLMSGSQASGLHPIWNCQSRVNLVDEDRLVAMKRAGCEFCNLSGPMATLIQRYIIKVERERKARDSGIGL